MGVLSPRTSPCPASSLTGCCRIDVPGYEEIVLDIGSLQGGQPPVLHFGTKNGYTSKILYGGLNIEVFVTANEQLVCEHQYSNRRAKK